MLRFCSTSDERSVDEPSSRAERIARSRGICSSPSCRDGSARDGFYTRRRRGYCTGRRGEVLSGSGCRAGATLLAIHDVKIIDGPGEDLCATLCASAGPAVVIGPGATLRASAYKIRRDDVRGEDCRSLDSLRSLGMTVRAATRIRGCIHQSTLCLRSRGARSDSHASCRVRNCRCEARKMGCSAAVFRCMLAGARTGAERRVDRRRARTFPRCRRSSFRHRSGVLA
jgi:hypothetical protein